MRLHILTALGIFLLATGCSGDKGEPAPPTPAVDEVNVVPAELTAPAEGGELTIHLDATGDWEVIEPNDVRDLHGRICTLSGTANDHSIRFAARANTSGKELVTRFTAIRPLSTTRVTKSSTATNSPGWARRSDACSCRRPRPRCASI